MKKLILLLVSCLILTPSTDAAPRQAVKTEDGTQLVLTDSISVAKKVKQSTKPKGPIEIHGGDAEDFITQLHDLFPEDKIWERTSFLLNPGEVSIPNLRLVTNTAEGVLKLYNRLAEVRPEWGEWLWEGEFKDAAASERSRRAALLEMRRAKWHQRAQTLLRCVAVLAVLAVGAQVNGETVLVFLDSEIEAQFVR